MRGRHVRVRAGRRRRSPQDRVSGVDVAVGQVVAHAADLAPSDGWLGVEQFCRQSLDGLPDFQQPYPDWSRKTDHGAVWLTWSWRPRSTSTGSTPGGCTPPSAEFHLPGSKPPTTLKTSPTWRLDPTPEASTKPGAVHFLLFAQVRGPADVPSDPWSGAGSNRRPSAFQGFYQPETMITRNVVDRHCLHLCWSESSCLSYQMCHRVSHNPVSSVGFLWGISRVHGLVGILWGCRQRSIAARRVRQEPRATGGEPTHRRDQL